MTTVAHTPAPWVVEKVRNVVALHIMAAHRGPGSKFCVATTNSWADHQEADARLIAAAPDYHAAAVAMIARHDADAQRANFSGCACNDCEPFRAAIGKATGQPTAMYDEQREHRANEGVK